MFYLSFLIGRFCSYFYFFLLFLHLIYLLNLSIYIYIYTPAMLLAILLPSFFCLVVLFYFIFFLFVKCFFIFFYPCSVFVFLYFFTELLPIEDWVTVIDVIYILFPYIYHLSIPLYLFYSC